MRPAIRVDNLSKQYRIGTRQRAADRDLREVITEGAANLWRRLRGGNGAALAEGPPDNEFWALKDVSFEVQPGEVVGIIGRNGAGKSTLLKILSRIVEPTSGRVEIRGRMGSLLEVGTGFHPELTGRENIYLNGSILGMSRNEIDRKFDEIVAFSEIDKFLDTPVKRYSSGMYVRLAFAVAAHLEPDILIVDEVLAVGDGSFQKKCMTKMKDVGALGRTILFVSHNMDAITRLCPRVALLDLGQLVTIGPAEEVISEYLAFGNGVGAQRVWPVLAQSPGNEITRLRRVTVLDDGGRVSELVDIRKPIGIEMEYDVIQDGHILVPNFHVYNEKGVHLFVVHDVAPPWRGKPRSVGRYVSTVWIPGNFFAEGTLTIEAVLSSHIPAVKVHCSVPEAVAIHIVDLLKGDSARGDYLGTFGGLIRPVFEWTTAFHNDCAAKSRVSRLEPVT